MIADLVARAAILAAAIITVPLALPLLGGPPMASRALARRCLWPAAACLAVALWLPTGIGAASLAAPWLLVTTLLALGALVHLIRTVRGPDPLTLATLCRVMAGLFIAVGGAWLLADRIGFRPLDFDPLIVTLTAAHFHHAGFALTILTASALEEVAGWRPRLAAIGVILGVPLVATGITTSQVGGPAFIETITTVLLASSVLLLAWLLAERVMIRDTPRPVRWAWGCTALCLVASMSFALLYGVRHLLPEETITIDTMAWTHGILNVLGPGIAGVIGCRVLELPRTGAGEGKP